MRTRFGFSALFLSATLIVAAVFLVTAPVTAHDKDPLPQFDDGDRLDVDLYVGEVVSNFSSSARNAYANPDEESSDLERIAGVEFSYTLFDGLYSGPGPKQRLELLKAEIAELKSNKETNTRRYRRLTRRQQNLAGLVEDGKPEFRGAQWELRLFGEAMHSARVLEAPCDATDQVCIDAAMGTGMGADEFFKIIRDSSTLEWQAGAQWNFWMGNPRLVDSKFTRVEGGDDEESRVLDSQTAVYFKAQGGFIRAEEAADDVVDNHFIGFGMEHRIGRFRESRLEAGWGRTDLFREDERSGRFKLDVMLVYTPGDPKKEDKALSIFLQGILDSDLGPGSDDVQIYFGAALDIDAVFGKLAAARQ